MIKNSKLIGMIKQHWLTIQQTATYLGMSRKSVDRAVQLKMQNVANQELVIKKIGSRLRIKQSSLDDIQQITTQVGHSTTSSIA